MQTLILIGTRPELIKLAPVVWACRSSGLNVAVCFTGQHRELLAGTADYFGIHPDMSLETMRSGQCLADLTAACLKGIDDCIEQLSPDCVIAQGDTTTVMAGALCAFYRRVPFVHVEAGLRTGNINAPWPEELHRRVVSLAAALHCAPTERSAHNLLAEGVDSETIHVTGNTAIDALLWTLRQERKADSWKAKYSWLGACRLVLITAHRRENFGEPIEQICRAIAVLAARFPETVFLYPIHPNPQVHAPVRELLRGISNVSLSEPLAYPEFVWLMDRCTLIMTDSGGLQEEGPSLGKPVLVLRETTERQEAVEAGAAQLVGTSMEQIVASASLLLTAEAEYRRRQIKSNLYGSGDSASRIALLLVERIAAKN